MTLLEWREQGEKLLRSGPHPERARRDAEMLLLHVTRLERAALLARWKEVPSNAEAESYAAFIERRAAGEPIQYTVGETEFCGLPFIVTPDVLIPRPETEHLVEKAIELARNFDAPQIVDVGTGSGAIAIALANNLPHARMTAIDFSEAALKIARRNAERNGCAERLSFLRGDLFEPVRGERFDIVVSNPPYVPEGDRETLAVEVREHEPALALFAGADGLDVIRQLIPEAFAALSRGGYFLMEFGYGQWAAVSELLAKGGFAGIEFVADLQGIPRVAVGRRP